MPVTNVAPSTAPIAAALPVSQAPVVTRLEQVVPRHSQRLVRDWRRRLQRAVRAFRGGKTSLGRRLLPGDLWLEHAEHSVASTAAWDWDLRPLARGLPAVPLADADGLPPDTGVNLQAWARDALGFPDEGIVSEVLAGVSDDSRCRRGTLLCAPHVGALMNMPVASAQLAASVANGWSEVSLALPCWPLRSCPYSIVDESVRAGKPKFRLTTDLSWPHPGAMWAAGAAVDAVNSSMDRSQWPPNPLLRVRQYAAAAAVLAGGPARRRVKLWSLDCEAFYRLVGRRRSEMWRNAVFTLEGGVQVDRRCCFGDAAAATKCARISNYLVAQISRELARFDAAHPTQDVGWQHWQEQRAASGLQGDLHWVAMYIDDNEGVSADDLLFDTCGNPVMRDGVHQRRAAAHFELARAVIERYGWRSAPSKEHPPCDALEALGVEVDLANWRMRLGSGKADRYRQRVRSLLDTHHRSCHARDFLQLLGRLQFAAACFPAGRQRLHACWRALRRCSGTVVLSSAVRTELEWWASTLGEPEAVRVGVPLASAPLPQVGHAPAIYADAAGAGGFMAWTVRPLDEADGEGVWGELLFVEGVWTQDECDLLGIAELELLASTWGLIALAPLLGLPGLVSFTDNVVAEAAMRAATPRSAAAQHLMTRRAQWALQQGIVEAVARVTSGNNVWADLGSRGDVELVCQQAAGLGLRPRRVAVPSTWRDTAVLRELAVAEPYSSCS